jgi:predicted PurR-regulated permease PerM
VAQLAGDLPRYELTMREKIKSLRGATAASAPLERAADVLQDLGREINKPKEPSVPVQSAAPGQEPKPIPVEVRQPPPTALENIAALIAPLLHPLATTGIIGIFVIFILLQREDLRNRFIKLAGTQDLQKTTVALNDAGSRLSRLFLMQLALNTAFGVVIGTGLWLIGIPSPVLWGILAAVLRFVPYVGAAISAVFPLILAAAVDPGWSMLLWTAALFLVVEPVVGQGIEPVLFGHSTGLSPVAVVASATFWTALWGPVGLLLATPLTICLVVLGRYVERLQFLEVMFSNRPALSPPELFYQRLLADDPAEAVEVAEEFLKSRPLSAYYEEVALAGLKLAHKDMVRGTLNHLQSNKIRAGVIEVVDDLTDYDDRTPVGETTHDAEAVAAVEAVDDKVPDLPVLKKEDLAPQWQGDTPVLCLAGRDPLDEAAVIMLAQLLEKHGLAARVEGADAVATTNIFRLETRGIALVFLSYLDAASPAHMRYTVRRLRRKLPEAQIVLGCWQEDIDLARVRDAARPDAVVTTLRDAVSLCVSTAGSQTTSDLKDGDDASRDAA